MGGMRNHQGFAAINGARLWYESAGEGPPVVFVHGFTLDHRMWDDQWEPFAARHRVLRYDLRGFGASSLPDAPYAPEDDLAALLDWCGIARAAIVGLSMGGGVAVDFALSYPERVAALVPVDAAISGHQWSAEWNAQVGPVWQAGRAGDLAGAKARWLASPLFAPARAQATVAARLGAMVRDYSGYHWTARDPRRTIAPPAAARLAEIAAPTLVVVGERDIADFHAIAGRLVAAIPGARAMTIPGAGHMANMEQPVRFNTAVRAFLAGGAGG